MASFATREVLVNDESSFCENANSAASNTYTVRLPVDDVQVTLNQERLPDVAIQNRQNERLPGYLGVRSAEITLTFPFYGASSAVTSTASANELYTLLKDGLGNGLLVDGSVAGSTPTTTDLNTTSTAEAVVLVGAKGDGKGDGQPFVYSDTGGTGYVALPAAPAQSDVVYGSLMTYPKENPATTKRFLVGWTESGAQYSIMGCQLSAIAISLPIGEKPTIALTYQAAYWDQCTETIPHSVAMPNHNWAPVAGGSMNFQTVSTTTRNAISPRSVDLTIDLGLAAKIGPGGVGTYQHIVGWERTKAVAALDFEVPWSTTYQTLFDTDGSSTTHKHILFSSSATAGRCVGFYLRRAFPAGSRPTFTDADGIRYQRVTYHAREGSSNTSDLTYSNFVLFQA